MTLQDMAFKLQQDIADLQRQMLEIQQRQERDAESWSWRTVLFSFLVALTAAAIALVVARLTQPPS